MGYRRVYLVQYHPNYYTAQTTVYKGLTQIYGGKRKLNNFLYYMTNKIETRPNELFQEEIVNGFKTMNIDTSNPKTILDFFINKIKW
jgi:hypothetical protein